MSHQLALPLVTRTILNIRCAHCQGELTAWRLRCPKACSL